MESLSEINQRLEDYYGKDVIHGLPMYRIVWSHDQFEKRLMDITDGGIQLLTPEVRLVPKYRNYIHNKWVLENLVEVPEFQQKELGTKISYEPLFVFETKNGQFLPYKWEAAVFVIDTVRAARGHESLFPKYVEPEPEQRAEDRVKKLEEELFGNETEVGDALAHKQGVAGFHSKMIN
jgi:hypothetical protein